MPVIVSARSNIKAVHTISVLVSYLRAAGCVAGMLLPLLLLLASQAVLAQSVAPGLHINEIESNGGTPDDWFELTNTSTVPVDISGWKMLDNDDRHTPYVFPAGTTVLPGGYLVVDTGASGFSFGLGAPDSVRIFDAAGNLYESYSWTAHAATTYGRCPNGTGLFTTTTNSTKGAANDCSTTVRLNEVESNGGTPDDWFELFNTGATTVDISGWKMLDNDDTHAPYVFPAGSVIAPGGFKVVDTGASGFNFGLGSADSVRIFDAGGTIVDSYSWTEHAATTYGRCPDGTGSFTTTASSTKGTANDCGGPVSSPVKLNEIESNGGTPDDWFELFNTGSSPVDISGWKMLDNDDTHAPYVFPSGTVMAPGTYLVVDTGAAGFDFGLGSADSVRIFNAAGNLVDSYTWTAHATTTYGRCPNGTGDFTTTQQSTKGTINICTGVTNFAAWPGGTAVQDADDSNVFGSNLSGLEYEGSGTAAPGVIWAVRNGPETLFRLINSGGIWTPDSSNDWGSGKGLRYPDGGTARPDSEGVTIAGSSANGIYVSVERDNTNNSVSRNSILRFDPAVAGSTLIATNEWNLTSDLPVTGPNLGAEAVSWVPDSFLTGSKFFDESKNHFYNPAEYPNHGTGLFFVGLETNGNVYAFALNHSPGGGFTRIATISTGFTGVMDLEFDAPLGNLWAVCDDTCQGRSVVLRIDANGKFVVAGGFERPSGMPNFNNEGFTIAPLSECVNNLRPVFWSDDTNDLGHALRSGTVSCSQVVTFPDTLPPVASPTALPTANNAGWNNSDVTVTWNWSDNAGGSGIDSANCTVSSVSSGEGTLPLTATCKDLAGNTVAASYTVKVDKTRPTIAITSPSNTSYQNTAQIFVGWNAADAGSGIASQSATLDGDTVTKGQVIDLFFQPLGAHTVVVSATDNAGNTQNSSVTFSITVTSNSLSESIDRLLAIGAIDNKGIANSLHAKLGKNSNQLNAFLNELDAQRGKHISQLAYDLLRNAALNLIANP